VLRCREVLDVLVLNRELLDVLVLKRCRQCWCSLSPAPL